MNKNLVLFLNDEYKKESSNVMDISFLSVLIGASELQILESAGHFDFSGKKLTNVADPTAAQHVATKAYVDAQVGGTGEFSDSAFRVRDNGDATKKMAFEVSAIATGTTRTVTMPNSNVDLGLIATAIQSSEKGAAGGVATLDGGGKVPVAQLPSALMTYEGVWNASTNSPTLADGVGDAGMVYRVSVAGTQDLGSGSQSFDVGDYVIYNGSIWQKSDTTDAVASVNGQTGVVVLTTTNISEGSNLYFTDERAQDAIGAMVANSSKISLTYVDGTPSLTADIVAGSLVNADISASAAIAYTKLALSNSIVNADIAAGAAIAYSKLNLSGSIVNADISASAAIAYSKLNLSNSIVAGDITAQAVTAAKIAASAVGEGLKGGNGSAIARDDAKSFTNDNAGAITVRQVVYVKSNGAVDLASDATSGLGTKMIGLVEDASIAAAASGKVTIRRGAVVSGFAGLTPGAPVYIGSSAGATTQTAPTASGTAVFRLGFAYSATEIEFNPMFLISNV